MTGKGVTMQAATRQNPPQQSERQRMTRKAISVAWPAMAESFFVTLAGMIDTMMVSAMGSYAVAAVGLTNQPKFIGLTLFFGVNIAVSALIARRKGEQRRENANEIMLTGMLLTAVLCVAISLLFVVFRIIMGGTFFNVLTMIINAAQRGSGNTRLSMVTNLTSSVVNVFFNYLLIGGNLGFPKLGIRGAAIATVLGTVVSAAMAVYSLFRPNSYIRIPDMIRNRIRATKESLKSIWNLAYNSSMENIAMRVGFVATALLAARLGTDEFAAHNIGMNILGLGFSFADGMQVAAVALTGEALGAGRKQEAREYGSICQRIGFLISIGLAVLLLVGGRWFYSLYFSEAHILDMGVLITRYTMVIVLLQISQIIYTGCLRAAGDVRYTLVVALISVTVIRTVMTLLLVAVFNLGLHGIWLGVLSDQLSRFLLMRRRFRQGKWVDLRI